jgi:hypothetical protein
MNFHSVSNLVYTTYIPDIREIFRGESQHIHRTLALLTGYLFLESDSILFRIDVTRLTSRVSAS